MLFEEVLALKTEVYGENHPSTLNSRAGLGELARVEGRTEDAVALYRSTLLARREVLGDQHVRTVDTLDRLALALIEASHEDEALPLTEEAVATCAQALDATHPICVQSKNTLAAALLELGRFERALSLTEEELALIESQKTRGEDFGAYEEARLWLQFRRAWALAERALASGDEQAFTQADELLISSVEDLPKTEAPTRRAYRTLGELLERRSQQSSDPELSQRAQEWLARAKG